MKTCSMKLLVHSSLASSSMAHTLEITVLQGISESFKKMLNFSFYVLMLVGILVTYTGFSCI